MYLESAHERTSPSFRSPRPRRSVWLVPAATFVAIYLLVAGVSLSNVDIRTQAEIVGLAALALAPALGFIVTWRAGNPPLGLAVNASLVVLIAVLASIAYLAKQPAAPMAAAPVSVPDREFLAPFGLGRDLEVVEATQRGAPVRYCRTLDAQFKALMLERLGTEAAPASGG